MPQLNPNQPFPSGAAGIPLLCIHRGSGSCPEFAIIFILLVPKLERCLTWDLEALGWSLPGESSFGSNRWVHKAGKKISAALGSVSTSTHDRHKSSWCVRWHSKQDHRTAASAEQNYYFLLLFSVCESRLQARLVSAAEKEKKAWMCFHALQLNSARHSTSFWRSWASTVRSDQTPSGFAPLRRKHTFFNDTNVKELQPVKICYYLLDNFTQTLIMLHLHLKAWLAHSLLEATLPAQLYAEPHRGGFQRHARDTAEIELCWRYLTSVPM